MLPLISATADLDHIIIMIFQKYRRQDNIFII